MKIAKKYCKRLERAKLEVDNRIAHLAGTSTRATTLNTPPRHVSLFQVLSDPSSLAFWLEYMERRGRSRLVQFWLTVEGFKEPLDDGASVQPSVKEDLTFVYEMYRDSDVSQQQMILIQRAIASDDVHGGHRAMLAAQNEVYDAMEEADWPTFQKTELFLKAAVDLSQIQPSPPILVTSSTLSVPNPRGNSSFHPSSVLTVAKVSTAAPSLERTMTEPRPALSRSLPNDRSGSLPVTPPNAGRPSQLDFLITSETTSDRAKLFEDDAEDADDYVQIERMEAIQAALNEIIASDDQQRPESRMTSSLVLPWPSATPKLAVAKSAENLRAVTPKLSSKSVEDLRAAQRTLFDDTPTDDQDEILDSTVDTSYDSPQPAAPGNLQLSVEIARLQDKITELGKQEQLLETLVRQAELVGNSNELRILQRSLSSVQREHRTTVFQKAEFEQQEQENRLIPGRTHVAIPSSVVTADHGKQVVRYTIEVKQVDDNGTVVVGWMVARRYNDFWDLDHHLHGLARSEIDLPPKRIVTNVSSSFIDSRRLGLERYLQSLVSSSMACDAQPLQAFLSRHTVPLMSSATPPKIVRSLYRTVATSLDDAVGPSMLDVMYSSLGRPISDIGALIGDELRPAKAAKAEALGSDGSFTTPICDFVIELFDLKENNWLRRQAIVVILQQLLGGTIER